MPKLYAISDPHGCLGVLENALSAIDLTNGNHLFLLGDYIPHQTPSMGDDEHFDKSTEALLFVRTFQRAHKNEVTLLMGNHEYDFLERCRFEFESVDIRIIRTLNSMKLYAETDNQIFVHAGINESPYWKSETSDIAFVSYGNKLFTRFSKDVIMGHRSASKLAGDPIFKGVFWDGLSHFVIDGETERTGEIPILVYDTETTEYTQMIATKHDVSELEPVTPIR